jgi:hypothetical protein
MEIQTLRSINDHLIETRKDIIDAVDRIAVVSTSYNNYDSTITKSGLYISNMTKR